MIELIIKGDHVTDVIAEVDALANALGIVKQARAVAEDKSFKEQLVEESVKVSRASTEKKPKQYPYMKQVKVADEMIENGEIDEEKFLKLNRKQQERVEKGIETKEELEQKDLPRVNFNGVDPKEARVKIAELIHEICADDNGQPIPEMLIKVKERIALFADGSKEAKVKFVSDDKLADLYAAIKVMENDN